MKLGRGLALGAGALVVVAGVAGYVVLGKLGRLIEQGVETEGPPLTRTSVSLGGAHVSIFNGEGSLSNLRIGNPQGFSDNPAFDLGKVAIKVDTRTLTSKVVHLKSVVVDGPQLLAEFDAQGRSNLGAILDNVKAAAGRGGGGGGGSSGGETKMIIDEFRFENAQARALAPALKLDKTLKLPPIVLHNLGAKQGGLAAADIANQLLRPVIDTTVHAATQEYVKAQRDKLGDKAKDKLFGKLFK